MQQPLHHLVPAGPVLEIPQNQVPPAAIEANEQVDTTAVSRPQRVKRRPAWMTDFESLCVKCKVNEPVSGTSDDGRFSRECFRSNLYRKFKLAVTSNAMITASDNLLVAFSSGSSSSKDRSLPVFGVGVTFIDESAYHQSVPSCEIDKAIEEIRSIISNLAPPAKQLHVVPIESVFSLDSLDGRERLKTLVDSVSDATGKEDLLLYLRMLALQKGNLKTLEFSNGPCSGINGLVSSFVKLLQEENPSRECTIVRTAGKLTPFHFKRIPELNDSNVPLATRRCQKRFNLKPSESISSESFCPLCFSPLSKSDSLSLSSCQNYDILDAACCSSCRFQIFPKDPSSMEHFLSVLPQPLLARAKNCSNGNHSSLG
ncbi:hypothetical protein LWI29_006191 [Acer saccharum]|uniref:Cytoplasmic tRNA 2-thiolation protein 2 n=1 Tax=Acer saccharum TaxID=4024 RepID=A0AA39SCW5_ACESA|nr:hypothetical protein LWI29_006191 [Acer saccharum]